jgi:hypothetical protein
MADDATPFERDAAFDRLWPVLQDTHPDLPARVALTDFCGRYGIDWTRVFPGAPKRNRAYAFAQTVYRMVSYVRRMLPYAAAATFFVQEADSRAGGVPGLVVNRLVARFREMYPLQSVDREDEDAIALVVEELVRERLAWLGDHGGAFGDSSSDDDDDWDIDDYRGWFQMRTRRLMERWADDAGGTADGWRGGLAVGVRADRARLVLEGRGFARLDALRRDARTLRNASVRWADRRLGGGDARWTIDQPPTILRFMDEIFAAWRPHFRWLLQRYPALNLRAVAWSVERLEMLARMGDALGGGARVPFARGGVVVRRDEPLRLETCTRDVPVPLEGDGGEYLTFPMPAEMEKEVAESLLDPRLPAYGGDAVDHMVRAGSRFWPKAIHACGRCELRLFAPLRGGEAPSWSLAPEFAARVAADLREMARRVG